jgi:hypothetical protein
VSWELGPGKTYDPGNAPLMESIYWPEDMSNWEAMRFAEDIEERITSRMGFAPCPEGEHWMMGDPEPIPIEARFRCPKCRAEP